MRACDDAPSWLFDWRGGRDDERGAPSPSTTAPRRDDRAPSQSDVDRASTSSDD